MGMPRLDDDICGTFILPRESRSQVGLKELEFLNQFGK